MHYEIVDHEKTTLNTFNSSLVLSSMQKDYLARDGFLVIKNFINSSVCQQLVDQAGKLISAFNPVELKVSFASKSAAHFKHQYFLDSSDKIHFFFEEASFNKEGELRAEKYLCINKIGHALHDLDPVFYCFSRLNKIAALMQDLEIQDPRIVQSMYVCKQPHFGSEVNCHQDSTYLYVNEAPITGLWFALEDATIENGCLWVIPGAHKTPLKSRMLRDGNNHLCTQIYDDSAWPIEKMIPLEVPRGSLIILHGLLPHMSKENNSERSRHAYTLHIMSGRHAFAKDNWLRNTDGVEFSNLF
jgi:phytanoyl-CoA hydroxylase